MYKTLKAALVGFIFLIFFLGSFLGLMFDSDFYANEQQELDIPFNQSTLDKQTSNILDYLQDKQELNDFFNPREKSHLQDVKGLIRLGFGIYYASLLLVLFGLLYLYKKRPRTFVKQLGQVLLWSGIVTIGLLAILALSIYVGGFSDSFTVFHRIFFVDNWQFDPATSNMIKMFPQQFFMDFSVHVSSIIIFKGFVAGIFGFLLLFFAKKK